MPNTDRKYVVPAADGTFTEATPEQAAQVRAKVDALRKQCAERDATEVAKVLREVNND